VELTLALLRSSSSVTKKIPTKTIRNTIVECICCMTPESFRDGVRRSGGKFLYRGENLSTKDNVPFTTKNTVPNWRMDNNDWLEHVGGWILNPKPDLLIPSTYGDPRALEYFNCLEAQLSTMPNLNFSSSTLPSYPTFLAKPSNGHIGTSDPQQAGQWGDVVSIWPLGDEMSYIWPKDRTEFFLADTKIRCDKFDDQLVINQDLAYALQSRREVLFHSWFESSSARLSLPTTLSAFLVVPKELDAVLLEDLQRVQYGL
jgi:hypothetical protein